MRGILFCLLQIAACSSASAPRLVESICPPPLRMILLTATGHVTDGLPAQRRGQRHGSDRPPAALQRPTASRAAATTAQHPQSAAAASPSLCAPPSACSHSIIHALTLQHPHCILCSLPLCSDHSAHWPAAAPLCLSAPLAAALRPRIRPPPLLLRRRHGGHDWLRDRAGHQRDHRHRRNAGVRLAETKIPVSSATVAATAAGAERCGSPLSPKAKGATSPHLSVAVSLFACTRWCYDTRRNPKRRIMSVAHASLPTARVTGRRMQPSSSWL